MGVITDAHRISSTAGSSERMVSRESRRRVRPTNKCKQCNLYMLREVRSTEYRVHAGYHWDSGNLLEGKSRFCDVFG